MSAQAKASALKRKAPTDLPPALTHPIEDNATQASTNHAQKHASVKEISNLYEQTYLDTITEIKRLLQYYAFVLAADANPDLNPDVAFAANVDANMNTNEMTVTVEDAKTELKAILDDLASKPEVVGMEEVRKVLMDCGIVVDVREGQDGKKEVDVRLL
ncbi:hypothetical protein ZTR_05804 [Talaromyces verruculosus]|nr:hypothetical protein ZTR_05804 [Talaromyces verruculosus]